MSAIVNPTDDANNCLQVNEVRRGFHGGILPETIFVFCRIAGFDMCEEDGFVLRLVDLAGFREVKLDHTLKFTEECLLDEILRSVVAGVAVDKAFILQWD